MPRFPFVQVDVFTSRPFEGNQLAVFTDAAGLTADQMQAIAREMNFSETTFVIPAADRAPGSAEEHRVRIFTVAEELPFAGHPTLGTAAVLHGISGGNVIWLDLKAGKIPVQFEPPTNGNGTAFGEMRQPDPEFGSIHSRNDVARILGLSPEGIRGDLPIQTVSTGLPFVIVPLSTLRLIQGLHIDFVQAAAYLERTDGKFFYFVSRETVDPQARLHARMIFYNGEDPATGSAAGDCIAWMVAHGVARPGERVLIEQGLEMRRPSQIFVRGDKEGDRIVNIRVGGHTIEVARGELNF
ncbi:MAG TPA: PhzF family phenazine biosynthesis protein [Terriglobales bacterium]|nr:PhzF family phenazine biosynthesis protein [Terriglobales bacterium]